MIVGHPNWKESFANKTIVEAFAAANPNAIISNIGVEYPNDKIDVDAEQKKLLAADTVVLQFPIEWYGAPSTMHKWFEDVLAYGFAFGHGGDKVHGKRLVASFTSGTPADTYTDGGLQSFTIDKFMPPFIALANRCGMKWGGYVYTGGMMAPFADADQLKLMTEACKAHCERLTEKISEKIVLAMESNYE